MTTVAHPIGNLAARGRTFWLPPHGIGNGLDAAAWALILDDIDPRTVGDLLDTLAAAAVPAFVSAARARPGHQVSGEVRLWVDSTRYSLAEDILMTWLRSASIVRSARRRRHSGDRGGDRG